MRLSTLCIERPVFATVISLFLVLIGGISFSRLTVREYPNIDPPVITVDTAYRGASPEIIETRVTTILEESLAGIEGIDLMTSVNRQESSQITLQFTLESNVETAANDVRDRVARVRDRLPQEIDEPIVSKVEADAQPIIYLAFSSETLSSLDVSDYADRFVKDQLQTLEGISSVELIAERRYAMRIWPDAAKMAAHKVTASDIEHALQTYNVELPAGRIEGRVREFSVLAKTDINTAEEFAQVILRQEAGYLVRLGDVAKVEIGAEEERSIARYKGKSAIALGIVKQSTANPLDVSNRVRAALPRIIQTLPKSLEMQIAYDRAVFIKESVKEVYKTIIEALLLVVVIIFIFLRSWRSTLIPVIAIPVSLLGTCFLMLLCGFTINTLTLLAIVLSIGLVVDDAIVMLENIFRYIEEGLSPLQAALRGANEIGFAVLAMTLTLAAVFIPVGFLEGTTGKLFTEFAWTLALSVGVSGLVALTLTPMMCSLILRGSTKDASHESPHYESGPRWMAWSERMVDGIVEYYRVALHKALNWRSAVIATGVGIACIGGFIFTLIPSELAPLEDRGVLIGIFFGPEGAGLEYMDQYATQIEEIYAKVPEAERYFMVVGAPVLSQGISFLGLKPWSERHKEQKQVAMDIAPKMMGIPGIIAFPISPPSLGQSARAKPVQFVLQGGLSYAEMEKVVAKFLQKLQAFPGIINVETDLKLNQPRIEVGINREKAALMGISAEEIGRTLEILVGSMRATTFKQNGKQYYVVIQLPRDQRLTPEILNTIHMRNQVGEMVPLSTIITLNETVSPRELNHFDRLRAVKITANLAPGVTLGAAIRQLESVAEEILPVGMRYDYDGESREYLKSSRGLYITFGLALLFIYLVLAAQFESFRDPLIILVSVPLSLTGALLTLHLSGGTLNIFSQIGLVTLIGLITKNSILIVEFTNQLMEEGINVVHAVEKAAVLRLRPILMTTAATILGALPLAIASGPGAESRNDIGWVIIGGLLVGTFFTLFVIPVVCVLMKGKGQPTVSSLSA